MGIWKKLFWSKSNSNPGECEILGKFILAKEEAVRDGVAILYDKDMKIVFQKQEDGTMLVTPMSVKTGEKGESWKF